MRHPFTNKIDTCNLSVNMVHCSVMHRSNWSLNIHPPGIPQAFECAVCPGRGGFERCLAREGNLNRIDLLFWRNTPVSFFGFCKVWQNLSLRRGISVLIGGAFERLFCPEGREFEQANLQSLNARGVDVEASIWLVAIMVTWHVTYHLSNIASLRLVVLLGDLQNSLITSRSQLALKKTQRKRVKWDFMSCQSLLWTSYQKRSAPDQEGLSLCHTEPFHHIKTMLCLQSRILGNIYVTLELKQKIYAKYFTVYANSNLMS